MAWAWDSNAARYRNDGTGAFLSRFRLRAYVTSSISSSGDVTGALATLVGDGALSPTEWHNSMREEIKREYIRQYILGRGGRDRMTQADWGSVGGMLADQYRYLSGFRDDLENLSPAQIAARSRMYINSAREGFERAHERVAGAWGADEISWNLTSGAAHCTGCEGYASIGWAKIEDDPFSGDYPGSGGTPCISNCQCFLSYRNSFTGEEWLG
jgi:hypothetical protein